MERLVEELQEQIQKMKTITGESCNLDEEIQARPHTDNFTGIIAYHYNHPREGSLCDLVNKGQI